MNPLAIFAIIVAIVVAYYGAVGLGGAGIFRGPGPLATGPGTSEVRNPQPIQRAPSGGSAGEERPRPGESPYKGKVRISTVQRGGERPDQEYVIINYAGGFFGIGRSQSPRELAVDVTGWRIGGLRQSDTVPRAFDIPEIDSSERDVILSPGGEIIVVTGTPSYTRNFRENQCTGYFNESHFFTPSLSGSCPDSSPDRSFLLSQGFSGECVDAIRSVSSCRRATGPFLAGVIGERCIDWMNRNFSYSGCVANFRERRGFLKNTWRVSLKRPTKMFDPRHDRVFLWDPNGLVVDEFEY